MATNRDSENHRGSMPFLGFPKIIADESLESGDLAPSEQLRAHCERALTDQEHPVEGRMNRELDMLHRLGLDDLILALWDIHRFAINHGHLAMIAEIIHRVAGFELSKGGDLLKALCKRSHDTISQTRERFRSGARQRRVEPQVADAIFADIAARGPHTFCKAHAMSYAFFAYQMAFLKSHFCGEFEAAVVCMENVASV